MGSTIEQDVLVLYPAAWRRDADPDDFSLEAIIAHERGHQLVWRHDRLRRNMPSGMSEVTEEVLASLITHLRVEGSSGPINQVGGSHQPSPPSSQLQFARSQTEHGC